jgi:uncharacterized membrane protein YvbJ
MLGMFMAYCHSCGEKLPSGALFCPKCGAKTIAGAEANAATPSEEVREAFNRMSVEMEKAFNIAVREMQQAFQTAKGNVEKAVYKELIVCPNCGEKNSSAAAFCFKCGTKLPKQSDKAKSA